jgi:hypothetical protein
VLSLPLYYLEVLGLRVLPFISLLPIMLLAIGSLKSYVYFDNFSMVSLLALFLTTILSIFTLSFDVLFAALVFFGLLFSSSFISSSFISSGQGDSLLLKVGRYYTVAAILMSLGVVFQLFAYKYFNFRFGMIGDFSGRTGFSFTWNDYSFLSLFIASAIPFTANLQFKLKVFIIPVLLLGMVVTSARTGIFSLLVFYMSLVFLRVLSDLVRFKLKKVYVLIFVALSFLSPLGYYLLVNYSSRLLNLNGSGRLEGYADAIYSIWDKPFFGFMFDVNSYMSLIGVLPHNMFLYILAMSGVLGIFIFNTWLILLLYRTYAVSNGFSHAIYICFIGAQLIPSIYSMYFLAILISCVNLSYRSIKSLEG